MSEKFYDEFYRQRRNLILISVVLFFVISSELTWNKYSVWGNEITLKNPDGVLTFLWVIWAYWIWRFWVYVSEYPKGFFAELQSVVQKEYAASLYKVDSSDIEVDLLKAKISYVFRIGIEIDEENDLIEGLEFYKFVFPILLRVVLSHKSFTDQILPFLIAIVPIIFLIFTKGIF